ncbi:MAG: helix-turn-helix transcriptional regulator [Anaerolineae bacterium]|nr:helix-turn-helix transcriptional regulator [Anaerolineae bacterium]
MSDASLDASLIDGALSFGEWLRRKRGAFGLTQAELAQQLNCALITLRKIEAEERRPSPEMVQRMALDCISKTTPRQMCVRWC